MSDQLIVYMESNVVGILEKTTPESFAFAYANSWLDKEEALPLSLSLPLKEGFFTTEISRIFFSNLLPEGQLRDYYAGKYRLSADNDFDLLEKLAGDCAGAISLIPATQKVTDLGAHKYKVLSDEEVSQLLDEAFIMDPTFLDEGDHVRLSLAGVQDKLPIVLDGTTIKLPLEGAPSTHILKPPNPRFPGLVENEFFCMRLAEALGLKVPATTLINSGDETCFVVERYDRRVLEDGSIRRIHQEDFCQATGTSYRQKYQERGGPGYRECFEVVSQCRQPLADRIQLMELVAFNYLIGNADAHAKNISLLYTDPPRPNLAPFYDLVSTASYSGLSRQLAMSIGSYFDHRQIDSKAWIDFSKEIGTGSFRPMTRILADMAVSINDVAEGVAMEVENLSGPKPVYATILDLVANRAQTILRTLDGKTGLGQF